MTDEEKPKNILISLLEGGDQSVKLITLGLVLVTGGGNFFATKQASKETDRELDRAIQEVHQLHSVMNETVDRQKDMKNMIEQYLKDKKQNGN